MVSQIKQRGFTIVELLIVIVVIAILAAISIAAYSNITARANTATAAAAAKSVKDVANAYNGANGSYPNSKALFVSGGTDDIAKLPNDITFTDVAGVTAAPTNAPKTVAVVPHGGTPIRGFTITYRDFAAGANKSETVGDVSGAAGTALTN